MPTYTQADRPLQVLTPLGPDVLLIEKLSGREMLSGLFHFQIDMVAEATREVPFDKLLGQPMTVQIRHGAGQVRYINGICSRLRQGPVMREAAGPPFVRYQAELVPEFWLWTKNVHSRIFQDKTPLEIFAAVIKGLNPAFNYTTTEVQDEYHRRAYCVQFQESSFAFASRLLEEEGIYYYFDHGEDRHRLMLSDRSLQHPALPAYYNPVPFEASGARDGAITSWETMQDVSHGYYIVRDRHFEVPGTNLEYGRTLSSHVEVGGRGYDLCNDKRLLVYDHNGRFAHRFESIDAGGKENLEELEGLYAERERMAILHTERTGVETLRFEGKSRCAGFVPGHTFTLDEPRMKGKYLLTHVRHEARQAPYRSGEGDAFHYENTFGCVPASLPYRPPQTIAPQRIHGTMTATVGGGETGDVVTDKYGRIKVRFHWDRRRLEVDDSTFSCWIRVMQPWAGKGWGMVHLPRVGQEVVVAFEEGYPDRPLVLGGVYNAAYMPPLPLPESALVSGIKTSVLEKTEDHSDEMKDVAPPHLPSGVLICDQKDEEVVHVQSAGDIAINASEDLRVTVPDQMMTSVQDEMWTSVGWGLPQPHWGNGKLKWGAAPLGPSGGERWDMLYGSHVTTEGMLANEYTIFSKNEIVIDPLTWAAGLTPLNFLLSGKVPSGRTEAVYGARNTVGFGPYCWTHHGPVLNRVASTKPWEMLWAIGHVAASAATCTLPFLYVASGNKDLFHVHPDIKVPGFDKRIKKIPLFGNSIVGWVDHAAGLCLALGNHFIRHYAFGMAELDAADAAVFLSAQNVKTMGLIRPISTDIANYAAYAAQLPLPNAVIDNRTVEGTSALQADRVQMFARKDGISLVSKGGSTVICSDKDVAIASGKCSVLVSDFAGRVDIGAGSMPGANSSIAVSEAEVALTCGANTKITMTPNSITFKAWDSTLELGPAGITLKGRTISLNDPALKVSPVTGVRINHYCNIDGRLVNIKGDSVNVSGLAVKLG